MLRQVTSGFYIYFADFRETVLAFVGFDASDDFYARLEGYVAESRDE